MRPPDPVPALKEAVARAIVEHLQGWTQVNAAELLRTDQPRVSDLRNGRLERFSLQKLIRLAAHLRATVTVDVRWDPHARRFATRRQRTGSEE